MIDPKPLFDDDDRMPAVFRPATPSSVMPTLLDLTLTPAARPPAVAPMIPQTIGEDPLVSLALARGQTLFPAVIRSQAHIIRNLLSDLIPLDFARLSDFGRDTLDRSGRLVITIGALNERFRGIGLETVISDIVEHAKAQGSHKAGWRTMLSGLAPFNFAQARVQLDALRQRAESLMQEVAVCAEDIGRLHDVLMAEVATVAILNDLADHGSMGDLLSRRSSLLGNASQELTIAARQAETLLQLTEQWIMRVDETRDATLPALGFSAKPLD